MQRKIRKVLLPLVRSTRGSEDYAVKETRRIIMRAYRSQELALCHDLLVMARQTLAHETDTMRTGIGHGDLTDEHRNLKRALKGAQTELGV